MLFGLPLEGLELLGVAWVVLLDIDHERVCGGDVYLLERVYVHSVYLLGQLLQGLHLADLPRTHLEQGTSLHVSQVLVADLGREPDAESPRDPVDVPALELDGSVLEWFTPGHALDLGE